MAKHRARADFFDLLSTRSLAKLYAAVFFTFAPLTILSMTQIAPGRPWYQVYFWMAACGVIAMGWVLAFTRNLWWLLIVIPVQALIGMLVTQNFAASGLSGAPHTFLGLSSALFIVGGYVLFIRFIRDEGIRTLRLQTEINLAARIHAHLVPPLSGIHGPVEVVGRSDASSEVGGDLLDLIAGEDGVSLYVADVSGHGVRSGVMMAMTKSAMRSVILSQREHSLVSDVNKVILQLKEPDMFVTFAHLRVRDAGQFSYTVAGHPSIIQITSEGDVKMLESTSPPLGVIDGLTFAESHGRCQRGDLFVLLTDGLLEAEDGAGNMFGEQRLMKLLKDNCREPLETLHGRILGAVRDHGVQEDDQTLLLVRVV